MFISTDGKHVKIGSFFCDVRMKSRYDFTASLKKYMT